MADKLHDNKSVNLVVVGAVDCCYRYRVHFWLAWMGFEHVRKVKSLALPDQISGRNSIHDTGLGVGGCLGSAMWSTRDSAQVFALSRGPGLQRWLCPSHSFCLQDVASSCPHPETLMVLPHSRMGMFVGLWEICWSRGPSSDSQRLWQKNNRNSVADYNCSSLITVINASIITSHWVSYCHFCFQPLRKPNRKKILDTSGVQCYSSVLRFICLASVMLFLFLKVSYCLNGT